MTFEFRPAVLERTNVLIGLAGPSGCGKTKSALRLARGLVGPSGKIHFIDTENRRGLHYATQHQFLHGELRPDFSVDAFEEAIDAAIKDDAKVIVIDSWSDEWDGTGGLMEWADSIPGGAGQNWKEPKKAHKKLVNKMLQAPCHFIFCLRADERVKIIKDEKSGKTIQVPLGWIPVCEKRFMYVLTASFLLHPDAPGVPQKIKLQDQHHPAFPPDQQITEAAGEFLAKWANSGTVVKEAAPKRTLTLTCGDGSLRVFGRTSEWLAGLQAELDASTTPAIAQIVWDANHEMFERIATAAQERKNQPLIEAVAAVYSLGVAKTNPEILE